VRATGPGVDDDAVGGDDAGDEGNSIASCCRGKELGTGVASRTGVTS
jgi:hypothetical protein